MRKEDFRPRLIVWQLTEDRRSEPDGPAAAAADAYTTRECLLTIDSIARTSKPIVVITGPAVLQRPDLFDVVQYGFALGLKIIIEGAPGEISDELLRTFSRFGRRVFRVLIDGCVVEGTDARYEQSPQYSALEDCIVRLRKAGYEVHFGMTLRSVEARQLAFIHDYAFRRRADGIYFHLEWTETSLPAGGAETEGQWSDDVIESIARIKKSSPHGMFFSPQCIRYARREDGAGAGVGYSVRWCHSCVGGKTFAYISPTGSVQACKELTAGGGNLRLNGYDFRGLWEQSALFADLRVRSESCSGTRRFLGDPHGAVTGERAA